MISHFENYYLPYLRSEIPIDFNYEGQLFSGPFVVKDRRHKYLHVPQYPIDNDTLYWVEISRRVFYRGYKGEIGNCMFVYNVHLNNIDKEDLMRSFERSDSYNLVTTLLLTFVKNFKIKKVTGNFLNYTLNSVTDPYGKNTLNLTKFSNELTTEDIQDNIINLSIF